MRYVYEAGRDIHSSAYLPAVQYFRSSIQYQYKDLKSNLDEVGAIDVPCCKKHQSYLHIIPTTVSFHSTVYRSVLYRNEKYRIVPYAVHLIPYASARPRSKCDVQLTFYIKENNRFSTAQYSTVQYSTGLFQNSYTVFQNPLSVISN